MQPNKKSLKTSDDLESSAGERRVTFSSRVQVRRGRILSPEECDLPKSTFWYSRSEYRRMREEIVEFRDTLRAVPSLDAITTMNCLAPSKASSFVEDEHHCLRGVEHFVFPDLKLRKDRRKYDLKSMLLNPGSHPVPRQPLHDSQHNLGGDGLVQACRTLTRQAALEAIERALADAEAILENVGESKIPARPLHHRDSFSSAKRFATGSPSALSTNGRFRGGSQSMVCN